MSRLHTRKKSVTSSGFDDKEQNLTHVNGQKQQKLVLKPKIFEVLKPETH